MKKYQPNPLNTFQLRELAHNPPHFYAVDFNLSCNEKKLKDWIWEHLQGRFYFGDAFSVIEDSNRHFSLHKRASFEIHSEASYFSMFLPDLNKF